MNAINNTANLVCLFHAIVNAVNLRKEVEDRAYASTRAWNNSTEAVDARQRFAAAACAQEEETAEALLKEVSVAELLAYAAQVVESKGLALDIIGAKWEAVIDGYHRMALTPPSCVVEENEVIDGAAAAAYDAALQNQEAVKAFIANR